MDKKKLRKIERPLAKPEYYTQAELNTGIRYLVEVRKIDDILQLAFFERSRLIEKKPEATYRIFVSDDDYITQDLQVASTKWLTGKMESIMQINWWTYRHPYNRSEAAKSRYWDFPFADSESKRLMEERFGEGNGEWVVFDSFREWQSKVRDRRRLKRYDRELAHTEEMMKLVPELPEDFQRWAEDFGMYHFRYLIVESSKDREKEAYCTHCGKHFRIDTKKMRIRNDERTTCPECESQVTAKTYKRFREFEHADKYLCIFQKTGGMLLARYFYSSVEFRKGDFGFCADFNKTYDLEEVCRQFIKLDGDKFSYESFEHSQWKNKPGSCWHPDTDSVKCGLATIYTKNLPDELADTPFRYSGLKEYQENEGAYPIAIWRYLQFYYEHPCLEYLVKTGLTHLCHDITTNWSVTIWRNVPNGGPVEEQFMSRLRKLPKPHMKLLRKVNGGTTVLDTLETMESLKIDARDEEILQWLNSYPGNKKFLMHIALSGKPLRKFLKWTDKQIALRWKGNRQPTQQRRLQICNNIYNDWRDYIGWCRQLDYDMQDEYTALPPDLMKAHDRVFKEYTAKKDAEMREKLRRENEQIMKIMQEASGMDPLGMHTKKLMIVVPKDASEIELEGKTLHHCVATYIERVAKGTTMILFVRRMAEPDVPYFTMEWRDHKVIQCRGSHNCDMPADVKQFVKAFEKKMAAFETDQEKKVS